MPHELQRIPTSGARAVEPVRVDGLDLLAVPQLAVDIPGAPPSMHGGDSDTDLLLFRREGERYVEYGSLPAPGGEDAECFTIDGRVFLAVASLRSGSGPYSFVTDSVIYEWVDGFVEFQRLETFAAKQFKHWRIGDRHFLGLAQGVGCTATRTARRWSTSGTASASSRSGDPVALGLQLAPLRGSNTQLNQ